MHSCSPGVLATPPLIILGGLLARLLQLGHLLLLGLPLGLRGSGFDGRLPRLATEVAGRLAVDLLQAPPQNSSRESAVEQA